VNIYWEIEVFAEMRVEDVWQGPQEVSVFCVVSMAVMGLLGVEVLLDGLGSVSGVCYIAGKGLYGVVWMCWSIGISVGDSVVVGWESVALDGKRCLWCWSLRILYGSV